MTSPTADGQGSVTGYEEAAALAGQDMVKHGIGRIRFVWDSDGIRFEHVPYRDVMLPAPPSEDSPCSPA